MAQNRIEPQTIPVERVTESEIQTQYKISVSKCHNDEEETQQEYSCDLCNKTFHLPNLLRLHKQSTHICLKPFRCEKCPEQFNLEKNFMIHIASHNKAPVVCPVCGVHFQRSAGYRGHLKMHMLHDNFHCKKCELDFEFEINYEQHLESNHIQLDEKDCLQPSSRKTRNCDKGSNQYRRYRCEVCSNTYTKASNLNRHRLTHTKIKPFECSVCSLRFTQKSSLQRHALIHSYEKAFKCPKCSLRFSQRGNLQTHIRRLHPKDSDLANTFPCLHCTCIFNKLNSLNRHLAKEHSKNLSNDDNNDDDSEYSFDKVMAQLKDLQKNMIHTDDDILTRPSLPSKENLNNPENPSEIDRVEPKESLEDIESQKRILDTLNPENEKSQVVVNQVKNDNGNKFYSCEICSKAFRRPYDLLRHIRVHTKEKPYECGICGRCFAIKNNLQVHLRIHGKDTERITNCFQCPECFTQFSSMRQLDFHVRNHEGLKIFQCKICDKRFRNSNNLRVHKYTHRNQSQEKQELLKLLMPPISQDDSSRTTNNSEENRRFQCSICGLKFKKFSHLSQHESNHSGLKPYHCLTCKRQFTVQSSLNTHQKIHSGHRAKQCDECGLKFRTNTELKRHKTAHSSARPFTCPYCQKNFKTKIVCKTHILTHMRMDELSESRLESIGLANLEQHSSETTQDTSTQGSVSQQSYSSIHLMQSDLMDPNLTLMEAESNLDISINPVNKQNHTPSKFIEIEELIHLKPTKSLTDIITVQSTDKPISSTNPAENPSTSSCPETSLKLETDNRKHVCETCNRAFKKPIDLRRHRRTHTDERPFQCNMCDLAFKLKCTLDTHMSVHDKNRVKFDCSVCGKSYASRDVLMIHIRIHTNDRPYKCSFCSRTFRTTGHRISHMRTHSNLPRKSPSVKGKSRKITNKTAIINSFISEN